MIRKVHLFLAVFIVGISFFAFETLDSKDATVTQELKAPSMIPGAEAVRPLAAQQSGRVEQLVSDLAAAGPEAAPTLP